MTLKCGIVGLPNVGKSTLFNALTNTMAAEAANYPFCTIEPNVGRVSVPDERLDQLAQIVKPEKIVPAQMEFVDIAGLVKGASKGEGLGNKFLSHIREVDAIVNVLRCFEDGNVTHVEGSVDPIRDIETIETELVLADLESVEKRFEGLEKKAKGGDKEAKATLELLQRVKPLLDAGKPARVCEVKPEEEKLFRQLNLLSSKPVMYVCNVGEDEVGEGNELTRKVEEKAKAEGAQCIIVSAKIEQEIANLGSAEEKKEFLEALGLTQSGLSKMIKAGYDLLNLATYFTAGVKEVRAWTIHKNAPAPEAAGVIHSDFQKGFICAETIAFSDYVALGGEQGAKDKGKMRQEGKEYPVKDGDVLNFRFNV